jgi:hypothetical protein
VLLIKHRFFVLVRFVPVSSDPLFFRARAAKLSLLASIGAAADRDPRSCEIFEGAKKFAILKETGDTQGHDDAVVRQSRQTDSPTAAAFGAQVLEIETQTWEWCLFRYGYRRHSSPVINISRAELEVGRTRPKDLEFLRLSMAVSSSRSGSPFLHRLDFARARSPAYRERFPLSNSCDTTRLLVWCAR